jgi:hypothetical protein
MCRPLHVHQTELTDQPGSLQAWPSVRHVGGTTTQPRSVRTRSPTKLFGNSSRGDSATATFYPRTSDRNLSTRPWTLLAS